MHFTKDDKIVIDLDGTITINDSRKGYHDKPQNPAIIEAIRSLAPHVHVTVFTARNMRTYAGDLGKIEKFTKPVASQWLTDNQVHFNELIMGKPWCGPNGFYVDDKNLHLEEFIFRFSPNLMKHTFDVVISCYNEGSGVIRCYEESKKIERLLNIGRFIFVNNGSTDDTLSFLSSLSHIDEKVLVLDNPKSRGYGDGYRLGIQNSTSDFVITNHADGQFGLYEFVYAHREELKSMGESFSFVFPKRVGRPAYDGIASWFLRLMITAITGRRVSDFNGQPKILKRSEISSRLEDAPHDFTFDLWVFSLMRKVPFLVLPVLQKNRTQGASSWNRGLRSQLRLVKTYLITAFQYRKHS